MIKTILLASTVVSIFSLSAFAGQGCRGAAAEAIQAALKNSPYTLGNLQDESSANSATYSAEVLENGSFAGIYLVSMNPENCAIQSMRFENANP